MTYERICTKNPLPTLDEMREFIGDKSTKIFDKLISYLDTHYNYEKEVYYGGMNYGNMVRFRRSGKTLVGIFPEKEGFSVILVYGKSEIDQFNSRRSEFSDYICSIYDNTKHYQDGRWLLIRLDSGKHFNEIVKMIAIKKLPNKKTKPNVVTEND